MLTDSSYVWNLTKQILKVMGNKVSRWKYKTDRFEHKLSFKIHDIIHCQTAEHPIDVQMKLPRDRSRDVDLQLLAPQTHFSPLELKLLKIYFSSFCSDSNHMYATKSDCKQFFFRWKLFSSNFHFTPEHEFILAAIFNSVNTAKDGVISFTDLALTLSSAIHGTFEEKASLSFRLYDYDGNEVLYRDSMRNYIRILNKLGILKLETKLQTSKTRGDIEEQALHLARTRSSITSLEMARNINMPSNFEAAGSELNASIPHMSDQNEPQTTVGTLSMSNTVESSSNSVSQAEVFDSTSSDESGVMLSDQEVDLLIDKFFGNKQMLTFEEYLQRSRVDKYFVEGLGIYDYLFLPIVRVISQFLASPDKYEKSGTLICNGRTYQVQIRSGLIYHYDPKTKLCRRVVHIDKIKNIIFEDLNTFTLKANNSYLRYKGQSETDVRNCALCILLHFVMQIDNRFNSFSPVRSEKNARYYPMVDGEEIYITMAHALLAAKEQIFIAGWCVNPFIYLIRNESVPNLAEYRLDQILLKAAQRGVQIFIIIWHESTFAGMNLGTNKIRKMLVEMSPNIHCIVHPRNLPFSWSHHQKIVVVDQIVAFVGGLDIGWGRFDNYRHRLADNDHLHITWPGTDYCNETFAFTRRNGPIKSKVDAFRDELDRDRFPRLPWHDVHCVLVGQVASDVASNFCGRWNHHNRRISKDVRIESEGTSTDAEYYTIRLDLKIYDPKHSLVVSEYLPFIEPYNVRAQIVRSISMWSGSLRTEESIQTAYIELIRQAQHYIYIENQYFISNTMYSTKVQNKIAKAIIDRIGKAISSREVFRVVIVLPVHHCGDIYDSSTHQIIKWQKRSIDGFYAEMNQLYPDTNLDSYISFFSLANYDFIFHKPHFSQIYVHSKLLLIDDKVAIIGSANINDRSMVGKHDSEIAVVIEDTNNTSTLMNGKVIKTGKSLKKLRKRLWREHIFGDSSFHQNKNSDISTHPHTGSRNQETKLVQRLEDLKYEDPISDKTYLSIKKRARENTIIYEQVFPHYPCKRHLTLAEYKQDLENYVQSTLNPSVMVPENTLKLLSNIKGHIIDYPRDWLKNDPLKRDKRLRLLDENLFY